MKIADLTATERRQIQRGHFKPAKTRRPRVAAPARSRTVTAAAKVLYRCHTCHEPFTKWEPAQRHTDETGHRRIEWVALP